MFVGVGGLTDKMCNTSIIAYTQLKYFLQNLIGFSAHNICICVHVYTHTYAVIEYLLIYLSDLNI